MKTKLSITLLVLLLNIQTKAQCLQSIDAGIGYTIVIKNDGTLMSSGANSYGQLGDGTYVNKNNMTQVGTTTNWQAFDAGSEHTLAVKTDGTLWAWGDNSNGELGDGTNIKKNIPTQIGTPTNWQLISLALGDRHTNIIKTDGTLWAWGYNLYGQLGTGTNANKYVPTKIGIANNWYCVAAGITYTVALKTDGTLWSWGSDTFGRLGNGTGTDSNIPTQIGTATNWQSISVNPNGSHTLAIKTDGTLWGWGENTSRQLGFYTNPGIHQQTPIQIGTSNDWQSVASGAQFSLATKTNGTLWGWGSNTYGQLGDGTNINITSPTQIGNETNWQYLSAGNYFSIALKTDGTYWAWGSNLSGNFGNGTNINNNIPIQINCSALGTNETHFISNSFSIYPNPLKEIINIQNSSNQIIDKIIITDVLGKTVMEQKGNSTQVNVEHLQQGIYLLQIFSEGKNHQKKLVKQ